MATLIVSKTYADTQILFEADLDAMKASVETFINTTKINDDNLQPAGITGTTKLAALSVSTANLADEGITGPTIASAAVTTAKIIDGSATAAKIDTGAVVAAKIAAAGIPRVALHALNIAVSEPAVTFAANAVTSEPASPYSGLSVAFTPSRTGQPVFITLVGELETYVNSPSAGTLYNIDHVVTLYKDGTGIMHTGLCNSIVANNASYTNYKTEIENVHTFCVHNLTAGVEYTFGMNFHVGASTLRLNGNSLQVSVWELP